MTVAAATLSFRAESVNTAQETEEFDEWARLAASVGDYSRVESPSTPAQVNSADQVNGRGERKAKGRVEPTINGRAEAERGGESEAAQPQNGEKASETNNRHRNGSIKVDRLPRFLLKGPAIDDEADPQVSLVPSELPGRSNDVAQAKSKEAASPFVLLEALANDLDIPPPPADSLAPNEVRSVLSPSPAARGVGHDAWVGRSAEPAMAPKKSPERPATDFDALPQVQPSKRVGVSTPTVVDHRAASRRRIERKFRRGAMVTASGVTIGGAAVALIYIIVLTATSVL